MASPVIGQYQLGDLVYYTLSYISASGSEKLLGSGAKAQEGVLVALNKQTGKVRLGEVAGRLLLLVARRGLQRERQGLDYSGNERRRAHAAGRLDGRNHQHLAAQWHD